MNHSHVRIGRAHKVVAACVAALCVIVFLCLRTPPSRAAFSPDLWFAGTRLILDHADTRAGTIAVGTTDNGLRRFLGRMGATLSYQPDQRYVVITTADRRTIGFK